MRKSIPVLMCAGSKILLQGKANKEGIVKHVFSSQLHFTKHVKEAWFALKK
jgi:hypothetical protein